jgi:hypothetical protein
MLLDNIFIILIRKILFGILVGSGFFGIVLFGKAIVERSILMKFFNIDTYYWTSVAISIFLGVLAMIIL